MFFSFDRSVALSATCKASPTSSTKSSLWPPNYPGYIWSPWRILQECSLWLGILSAAPDCKIGLKRMCVHGCACAHIVQRLWIGLNPGMKCPVQKGPVDSNTGWLTDSTSDSWAHTVDARRRHIIRDHRRACAGSVTSWASYKCVTDAGHHADKIVCTSTISVSETTISVSEWDSWLTH